MVVGWGDTGAAAVCPDDQVTRARFPVREKRRVGLDDLIPPSRGLLIAFQPPVLLADPAQQADINALQEPIQLGAVKRPVVPHPRMMGSSHRPNSPKE